MLAIFGAFSKAFADEAPELPWAKEWVMTIAAKSAGTNSSKLIWQQGIMMKALATSSTFKEFNELISKMNGKPSIITPEYINYYMGYEAVGTSIYGDKPNEIELDAEAQRIYEKSSAGTLVKSDLRGRRWIHMLNALDLEEKNCLAISVKNGVIGGCGDIWQDGVTEDEVVCHKGYNYFKCHVECMNKIYNRQADVQPGFCPEK